MPSAAMRVIFSYCFPHSYNLSQEATYSERRIMKDKKQNLKSTLIGFISGILNGLFGSGGGIAAVPLFEKTGVEAKKSHATSVALIFCLSIAAVIGYYLGGNLDFGTALSLIPSGLLGAAVGSGLLKRIDNTLLRRIFGVVMLISGGRMLFK